jgi:hypothetical protein
MGIRRCDQNDLRGDHVLGSVSPSGGSLHRASATRFQKKTPRQGPAAIVGMG